MKLAFQFVINKLISLSKIYVQGLITQNALAGSHHVKTTYFHTHKTAQNPKLLPTNRNRKAHKPYNPTSLAASPQKTIYSTTPPIPTTGELQNQNLQSKNVQNSPLQKQCRNLRKLQKAHLVLLRDCVRNAVEAGIVCTSKRTTVDASEGGSIAWVTEKGRSRSLV
jgi:hypothetical protein